MLDVVSYGSLTQSYQSTNPSLITGDIEEDLIDQDQG